MAKPTACTAKSTASTGRRPKRPISRGATTRERKPAEALRTRVVLPRLAAVATQLGRVPGSRRERLAEAAELVRRRRSSRSWSWACCAVRQSPGADERCAPRATAGGALAALTAAHDWWRALLSSLSEDELAGKLGPVAGQYAEATRSGFVLHQLDEQIHHGAEVALLRDFYAATVTAPAPDPVLEQVLTGRLRAAGPAVDKLRADRPDLVRWAATNGYRRGVPVLVELGFGVDAERDGATALHHAAAARELEVARLLIANGADLGRRDATFDAAPAAWAEFFGHAEVARELGSG
jgi:hypothetical protein